MPDANDTRRRLYSLLQVPKLNTSATVDSSLDAHRSHRSHCAKLRRGAVVFRCRNRSFQKE
ncbi:hypothetical protein C0Z17_18935 [Trinickia caryophylli]|nr:hypothetical protein C0Z17_18935 [Trinickia caryophylli]